ncbi:hypothetical protein F4677DRAFT_445454 [Hypoxylon crocopeplum]|nr:hypothetical protein F4677DRAFT_445454 [Hypoxylon crocopeplum]
MLLVLVALVLAPVASLAQTVQDSWTFPESPDYSSTLVSGNNYSIKWTPALQDAFDTVGEGVDVKTTFTYPWTVNIPSSELDDTPEWVFRFVPSRSLSSFQQISSSIFLISGAGSNAPIESSLTTSPSTSQTAASSTEASNNFNITPTLPTLSSLTRSVSVSMPATPTPTTDVTGVPKDAWIAGPVVGSVGGVSLIFLAGFLLWRRKGRNVAIPNGPEEEVSQLHSDHFQQPQELEHNGRQRLAELYSH